MDLGLAFDDEDLEANKKQVRDDLHLPYNVKICTPRWFEPALESHVSGLPATTVLDPEHVPHTHKFSGDLHYHQKQYEKAIIQYHAALAILPENNPSVRQDVRESLARCYMYVGRTEDSLKLAREIVQEMSTEDEAHQRQALILLSSVCEKMGRWSECIESLERLCTLQPYYPQSWSQLGDAYISYSEICKTAVNGAENAHGVEDQYVKPLTCYIRASLLFQSVMGTASDVIRARNQNLITQLSSKVGSIPFPETLKQLASQQVQREIENQSRDSNPKDPSLEGSQQGSLEKPSNCSTASQSKLFYNKFCSWYLNRCI